MDQSTKKVLFHYIVRKLEDWQVVAPLLLNEAKHCSLWCFQGDVGAGKTTLIKALCQHIGVQERVTSPSFSLVNVYNASQGQKVFHCDFYRLQKTQEVIEIGFEDYLDIKSGYVFIEWPYVVLPLLYSPFFHIDIKLMDNNIRKVQARCVGT